MVKKLCAVCITLLLIFACAAAELPTVVDQAGLFTRADISRMESVIEDIRSTYQMDAMVLTTRLPSMSDSRVIDYADEYFRSHGYGMSDDKSGVLVLIDMGNRLIWLCTAGVMVDYLDDDDIQRVVDAGYDAARMGEYGTCALQMLQAVRNDLKHGVAEGHFRYDTVTGKRLSGIYNKLTTGEAVFALVAGLIAAAVFYASISGVYSLRKGTYHFDKSTQASMNLRDEREQFVRQTVVRHRDPPPSSGGSGGGGSHHGGSGVHVSSGGGSFGGGGRHF